MQFGADQSGGVQRSVVRLRQSREVQCCPDKSSTVH